MSKKHKSNKNQVVEVETNPTEEAVEFVEGLKEETDAEIAEIENEENLPAEQDFGMPPVEFVKVFDTTTVNGTKNVQGIGIITSGVNKGLISTGRWTRTLSKDGKMGNWLMWAMGFEYVEQIGEILSNPESLSVLRKAIPAKQVKPAKAPAPKAKKEKSTKTSAEVLKSLIGEAEKAMIGKAELEEQIEEIESSEDDLAISETLEKAGFSRHELAI